MAEFNTWEEANEARITAAARVCYHLNRLSDWTLKAEWILGDPFNRELEQVAFWRAKYNLAVRAMQVFNDVRLAG